jgi:hypothetical protein
MGVVPNAASHSFYIINAGQAGSNMESWTTVNSPSYTYMLPFFEEGLKKGPLCGLVWHQGEADSGTQPPAYATMLQALISNVRKRAGTPNLPVVAGQIGTTGDANLNVNQGLEIVASMDKNFAIASSAGVTLKDHIHYNSASQRLMGQRYAAKFMEVFNKQ